MLVFISSKVYAYKRAHGDHLSNRDILKILFTSSIEEPVVVHLHGILMVDGDCIDREVIVPNLQQHFPDGTEKRRAVTFAQAESENCDDDHLVRAPNNVDWSVGASGVSSASSIGVSSKDLSSKDLSLQSNDGELHDLSGYSVSGIYSSSSVLCRMVRLDFLLLALKRVYLAVAPESEIPVIALTTVFKIGFCG